MTDTLEEIERNISTSSSVTSFGKGPSDTGSEYPIGPIATAESPSTPTYDTSLQKKWFAAFINSQIFGRFSQNIISSGLRIQLELFS